VFEGFAFACKAQDSVEETLQLQVQVCCAQFRELAETDMVSRIDEENSGEEVQGQVSGGREVAGVAVRSVV
jgi:hypothetical protein